VTHQAVDKILQQMAGLPEVAKPVANPPQNPFLPTCSGMNFLSHKNLEC
jgi:hypothetical protein